MATTTARMALVAVSITTGIDAHRLDGLELPGGTGASVALVGVVGPVMRE